MAQLVVERGPETGQSKEFNTDEQLFIGRAKELPFPISDQMASRRHAVIAYHKGKWLIKDLGSANGTVINGKPLASDKAAFLKNGDAIRIGETLLFFTDAPKVQDPLIGRSLGGYQIESRLGRGAMGIVYEATQISLNRKVALKILSEDIADDSRFSEMFVKEARAAAALNNPNILQVYDVGQAEGFLFISMEIASGGSVLEELRRETSLDLDRSIQIVLETLNALAYAEKKGIVHRDIKPDNLMIGSDGDTKLGDLGLAASSAELTGEQSGVFGTPHYIAPEQAQGKAIDHRADIYALGATWYRLLTGQTLFGGSNVREILRNQVRTPHRPITKLMPDVPQAISNIIDMMLAKDPEDRYQSATEVRDDIEIFLANRGVAGSAIVSSKESREKPVMVDGSNKRKYVILALVIVVLASAGAAAFFMIGGDDKPKGKTVNPKKTTAIEDQPQPSEGDPAAALAALISAKQFLDAGDPASIQKAKLVLEDLLTDHPGTESAEEATEILDGLLEETRKNKLEIDSYHKKWENLVAEANGAIASRYKSAAITAAFDEFSEALKAHENAGVQELAITLPFQQARETAQGHLERLFRLELGDLRERARRMSSVAQLSSALSEAESLIDEVDVEALKAAAQKVYDSIDARLKAQNAAIERAESERLKQSLIEVKASFDPLLIEINALIRKLEFEKAAQALKDWKTNTKAYVADQDADNFADLKDAVEDRLVQIESQAQALRWLVRNWASESEDEITLEEDSALAKHFKATTFGFRKTPETFDDYAIALWADKILKNNSEEEVRALPYEVLREILSQGVRLDPTLTAMEADKTFQRHLDIGALLMEFELYQVALSYCFRPAEENSTTSNTKVPPDVAKQAREYMAWAYLGLAKQANDREDYEAAERYLKAVKNDYPDTRAARD